MKEWTNPYNPFNSMKALVHADSFESILNGKPKNPIVLNFDLTNKCNYNCNFCMFGGQRERADKQGENFRKGNATIPEGYALTLPKIWADWGVKAVCLAGGGEPTLHKDCLDFIKECKKNNLELGFVTNGLLVDEKYWKEINNSCKFVGFSIDAGTREDYSRTKGVPKENFKKVLDNMKGIRENGNVQIGYKFVLDKNNYEHIYEGAVLAKIFGANHFQFRPAIEPDFDFYKDKIEFIKEQINRAQALDDKDFQVFGVMHKFNENLSKKHNFKKCLANLLTTTWCADGKVYMCTDTRGNDWSYLINHYPNPEKVLEYWGSKEHLEKISKIDFKNNCDRCTLGPYNEMFEQVFIQDKMDRYLI
jgi:MoaA/NifB/PqqE/SkfB family radical SAM enzyme